MEQACHQCSATFEITDDDLAFYDKVSPVIGGKKYPIPPPALCPDCRMQRRLSFRNQTTVYKRKCDKSGKDIVSIYSPDKPFVVYAPDEWWGDGWDAMDYGKEIDFSRSFFEQFAELMKKVPHIGVLNVNSENSDYTNQTYGCRNCYLSSAIKDCEDSLYCHNCNRLTGCVDCSFCFDSQLLYQCRDTFDSYHCAYVSNCIQCTDSAFLHDCVGCSDCFGCTGLRNKKYHFFNEECTKEQYETKLLAYPLSTTNGVMSAKKQFAEFLQTKPCIYAWLKNCENVTGNNIKNSKNSKCCFDSNDLEDCKYSSWLFELKDCYDCYGMGVSEAVYDCVGVEEVQRIAFSFGTSNSSECYYTDLCFNCQDCFGCVCLRKKQYCIFNKQYTKEQYEELVPKIIEHMKESGKWGEFFPTSVSAFAYNESKAHEQYPLSKEEVLSKGWQWKEDIDQIPQVEKIIPADRLPDDLENIPDDVINWAIQCEKTTRPFLIAKQELPFYRKWGYAIPHVHPEERQKERLALRNPQKLWKRECGSCGEEIETTYDPKRSETVYCEKCYLAEVY
jgi:hypothetical protein